MSFEVGKIYRHKGGIRKGFYCCFYIKPNGSALAVEIGKGKTTVSTLGLHDWWIEYDLDNAILVASSDNCLISRELLREP